jgi:predicted methyltransferase
LILFLAFTTTAAAAADAALQAAIAGAQRSPQNLARDAARHPYETLTFWGLKPGQTVIEVSPGTGYWTEILAPYARATGGAYVATAADLADPNLPEPARKGRAAFEARFADEARFGKIGYVGWGLKSGPLGPPGSADMVITARNIHDWMWTPGALDKFLADFYAVLKPGGVLAVEEHRADPRPQVPDARDGYVATAVLVAAVEKAGFRLEASSEVNANPKDTKDYPFGVWTLPPTNRTAFPPQSVSWPGRPADAPLDPARYQAIGESDRMTLRFRKPG